MSLDIESFGDGCFIAESINFDWLVEVLLVIDVWIDVVGEVISPSVNCCRVNFWMVFWIANAVVLVCVTAFVGNSINSVFQ